MRAHLTIIASATIALACTPVQDEFSIEFPTQEGVDATTEIALTAFVPLVTPQDSDTPNFLTGDLVGVFPPTRIVDPETIDTYPNLGAVLEQRSITKYPFDGSSWDLAFREPDLDDASNPWGAVMLHIEARGEARTPDEMGSQRTSTLLSGYDCVRMRDASHPDNALDRAVKKACRLIGDPSDESPRVSLQPIAPTPFTLAACDGVGTLAGAKNQTLSPGPAVCLSVVRCDNVVGGGRDCFDCKERCSELDDLSNVPIVFTVDQPGGAAGPKSQVVLTNEDGRAQAPIDLDACETNVIVRAQVLGRTQAPVEFSLECVEPIESFACLVDVDLGNDFVPSSISTIPGVPGACTPGNPDACDQVAVLRDNGSSAVLEVYHPSRSTLQTVSFQERTAVAVHGFFYDVSGPVPSRPAVAVAVSNLGNNDSRLRIYVYEFVNGELVPHDGATGLLPTLCTGWSCGNTGVECSAQTCAPGNTCYDGLCVLDETGGGACSTAPAGCACTVEGISFQTRVNFVDRDLDGDGLTDLAVGTDGRVIILFHRSGLAGPGEMYGSSQCECGRYGQSPNAFALGTFGGAAPDPTLSDLYIGATGGSYVKYAARVASRSTLQCSDSTPLGDGMSVRDVVSGAFSCPMNDPTCDAFDDIVSVAAKNITGGGPEDPGVVRMIIGSSLDLTMGPNQLERPGVRLDLFPRTFPERTEPRDPQRAELGDFNGDNHLDVAVLYRASSELHLWLGASNHALGESAEGILLDDCDVRRVEECTPLPEFGAGDFNGDGRTDLAVICNATGQQPTLRFFAPQR